MTTWTAVLLACGLALLTKVAGHLVPPSWLAHPKVSTVLGLLPVALLAALVAVQTVAVQSAVDQPSLRIDARAVGVLAALAALLLRAPFLVVIVVAAGAAAAVRALGWAA